MTDAKNLKIQDFEPYGTTDIWSFFILTYGNVMQLNR